MPSDEATISSKKVEMGVILNPTFRTLLAYRDTATL